MSQPPKMFIDPVGDEDKWEFREDHIPVVYDNIGYPYKVSTPDGLSKLIIIRDKIRKLCYNLIGNEYTWQGSKGAYGVHIFLDLHCEFPKESNQLPSPFYEIAQHNYPVSKYLLSEMPKGNKHMGLNKPRMRHIDFMAPKVGKDGQLRAMYRDIFLDLGNSDNDLKNLVIHELAHSMANHIVYRPDDHHADFKWAEKLIKDNWP